MKNNITIILLLSISLAQAQKNKDDFAIENVKTKSLTLKSQELARINTSFGINDIQLVNASFNKNAYGFIKNKEFGSFAKLSLSDDEIKSYLAGHFLMVDSDTASTLLCVLKKLLLSDNIYLNDGNNKTEILKENVSINSGVLIIIEFFLIKNHLSIPLYRFDSTFIGNKFVEWGASEYIATALSSSITKMERLTWTSVFVNRKKVRKTLLDSTIAGLSPVSAIVSNSPVKGVYKSFAEFKNNSPSISEFTVTMTDKADFIYTKNEKNTEMLRTDIWGYSDGINVFVYAAENLFKLYPVSNTFATYGAKDYTRVRKMRIATAGVLDYLMPNSSYAKTKTKSKFVLKSTLLIVDMDDGELY